MIAARSRRRIAAVLLLAAAAAAAGVWFLRSLRQRSVAVDRASPGGRPVLFVGLDGADWQYLDPLITRGLLPNLARLVADGQGGVLTTIHPPLSPLVWTTMMTGVSPLQHRILDFTKLDSQSGTPVPITCEERKAPAIWEMASQAGLDCQVFGLWATHPAESIRGVMVSDRFVSTVPGAGFSTTGAVSPPERETWAREVASGALRSVDIDAMRSYLPWLTEADYAAALKEPQPYSQPVSALHHILVETRTIAGFASSRDLPRLTILYFQGTDAIGHVFAPYAPPRQESISEEDFERFSGVPAKYFQEMDRLLGDYRARAEAAGAALFIASDHGFSWVEDRPKQISSLAAGTAAKWHRNEGLYLIWWPGIRPAPSHPHRGSVQQVCSTFLALLGLPAGKGLYGPALPGAPPDSSTVVEYSLPPRPVAPAGEAGSAEQLEKLRDLGYIDSSGSATHAPRGSTRTASSYNNEGLILRESGNPRKAAAAFEQALALDPSYLSPKWNLSELLLSSGEDPARSDRLLVEAMAAGLPDGVKHLIGRVNLLRQRGETERGLALLDRAIDANPGGFDFRMLRGRSRLESRDCPGALADFEAAARLTPTDPLAHASIGVAALCLGDRAGAARAFRRSLDLDPNQPEIRRFLDQATAR